MVMLNCCVACWPPLSATRSVKMNVPAVVGVPVLRPGDVVSASFGGSWPATSTSGTADPSAKTPGVG
jgi:hypothetical protein